MDSYTEEELQKLPVIRSLKEALRSPGETLRLDIYESVENLAGIAGLPELRELSVSCSDITSLLPYLSHLSRLRVLSLQTCRLTGFPAGIGLLRNLSRLELSQNHLRELPDAILNLQRLKYLGMAYNSLEILPANLGDLSALEFLNLHCNQLTSLPASIGKLRHLRILNLFNNKLRTLPSEIRRLTRLQRLSLAYNPFESLPECLSRLSDIPDFSIEAEKRPLFMDWAYPPGNMPPRMTLADMRFFPAPGDALQNSLLSLLEENNLEDAAGVILGAARSAVKIETTVPDDYSVPGNSRFGGFPDLGGPADFPGHGNGTPWSFLAQINLADLAPHVHFLPPSGLLSFFVRTTHPFAAKVLFLPDDPAKLTTVPYEAADQGSWDDFTHQPHRVRFEPYLSLSWEPGGCLSDTSSDSYQRYATLVENPDHQINGDSAPLAFLLSAGGCGSSAGITGRMGSAFKAGLRL